MGGCCCCCSSSRSENSAPPYYYNPRASVRHVPLSSHNSTASALSSGLLIDTNLEVSVPDAYQPPPAPVPFDAAVGHPQTRSAAQGIHNSKRDEAVAASTRKTSIKFDDAKELDCKAQATTENESSKGRRKIVVQPVWKNMMQKIQKLSQNVSIIFISRVFLNGWKEVRHVLCVIRK
ncbi:hypothetical protein V6N13_046889 [Hibiscus sabdariffa]